VHMQQSSRNVACSHLEVIKRSQAKAREEIIEEEVALRENVFIPLVPICIILVNVCILVVMIFLANICSFLPCLFVSLC
jgi:hypothetical protein